MIEIEKEACEPVEPYDNISINWTGSLPDLSMGASLSIGDTDVIMDTVNIDTNETTKVIDENGKLIWVKPPNYKPEDVAFKPSKYHINFYSMSQKKTIMLDVYDLLEPLMLPNAELEHTFKKIVRCGKGDKSLLQDLEEAKTQLEMGIERIKKEIK